jgi:hypothetical protein
VEEIMRSRALAMDYGLCHNSYVNASVRIPR